MAYVRGRDEGAEGVEDFCSHAVSSVKVSFGDVFPQLVKVGERLRMESAAAHV